MLPADLIFVAGRSAWSTRIEDSELFAAKMLAHFLLPIRAVGDAAGEKEGALVALIDCGGFEVDHRFSLHPS